MTPQLYGNEPLPNNEDEAIEIKSLTPLFDETLISNLYRKMTYLCIWSRNPFRDILTMIHIKDVFDLTEFVFRKFREVSLNDMEFNEETSRNKKRKLDPDSRESDQQDASLEIRPDTPTPNLPLQTLTNVQAPSPKQEPVSRKPSQKYKSQETYRNKIREYGKDIRLFKKRRPNLKKKCTFTITKSKALFESVMLPWNSAHSLSHLFNGCINFVPMSRLARITDIDKALKAIVQFGKVVCIQDHWIEKGSAPTKWMGALVTYKRPSDCRRVLKESFSCAFSGLVPMDVKKHLFLIAQMEIKLMVAGSTEMQVTTCVVISRVPHRASREKLRKDLELYGELQSCQWKTDKGTRWNSCEVAYRFTVEAFAAALALDGKRFYRSVLKTRLKMSEKLRRLHLMVSGSIN